MRSKRAPIRPITPDPVYGSTAVTKLINYSMYDGKRSVAEKQVYAALSIIEKETKKKPIEAINEVIEQVGPQMEVRSRRVGGAAYQVPMPVRPERAQSLAIRWLVQEARKRSSSQYHSFGEKLAAEMMDSMNGQGGAVARRQTAHRMADANKAFAHFRW
jgi:small subunit ribosomal protein S7